MANVTYQAYLRNPNLREDLEREARALRRQEFDRMVIVPMIRWVRRAFTQSQTTAADRAGPSASFQA